MSGGVMIEAAGGQDEDEPSRKVQRVEVPGNGLAIGVGSEGSINAIFALSGPRGGIYNMASGAQMMQELCRNPRATISDEICHAIADAWRVVCVPAESYWSSQRPLTEPDAHFCGANASSAERGQSDLLSCSLANGDEARDKAARAHHLIYNLTTRGADCHATTARIPDPCRLALTFYGSRLEAMAARGYEPNRGQLVVAVDRHYGNGSKLFNVLARGASGCCNVRAAKPSHGEGTDATQSLALDQATGGVVDDGAKSNEGAVSCLPGAAPTGAVLFAADDELATFIDAIPRSHERNLYVVVDENCPVDPYLDIDCALDNSRRGAVQGPAARAPCPVDATPTSESLPLPWAWADNAADATHVATLPSSTDLLRAEVESILDTVLHYMQAQFEKRLHARLQDCVVLTSSVQTGVPFARLPGRAGREGEEGKAIQPLELKLSFHVHMRLADGAVFANIAELHRFMTLLREELDQTLRSADAHPDAALRVARVVRGCVDFGVYTRWRAFRLPYNVKSPMMTATMTPTASSAATTRGVKQSGTLLAGSQTGLTLVDAAVDDLLRSELTELGIVPPDVGVGAVARSTVCEVVLSTDDALAARQRSLLRRLLYSFRFLLPLHASLTTIMNATLRRFLADYAPCYANAVPRATAAATTTTLDEAAHGGCAAQPPPAIPEMPSMNAQERLAFASLVLDRACIQRDVRDGCCIDGGISQPARLLYAGAACAVASATSSTSAVLGAEAVKDLGTDPFALERPPRPRSVRITVTDMSLKQLLVEVFICLSPYYGGHDAGEVLAETGGATTVVPLTSSYRHAGAISAARLQVQYEEAIRAYYVYQKENKFCLRLGRFHKSTYGQLYLTYGSIKVRCYSNDCCDRCLVIPWSGFSESARQGESAAALLSRVPGYPDFARLSQLRAMLFPPLSTEELVRRYGVRVLRAN